MYNIRQIRHFSSFAKCFYDAYLVALYRMVILLQDLHNKYLKSKLIKHNMISKIKFSIIGDIVNVYFFDK